MTMIGVRRRLAIRSYPASVAVLFVSSVIAGVLTSSANGYGADRFVTRTGVDAGNDCSLASAPCSSIAHALSQAVSADTVKVAKGKYRENLVIDQPTTLAISGGWTSDFVERDVAANRTIIDGSRLSSVVRVQAGAGYTSNLALDGVTVTKGFVNGGISISAELDAVLTVSLTDVVVRKNGGSGTDGAGISVDAAGTSVITLPWANISVTQNKETAGGSGGALAVRARDASSVSLSCSDCDLSKNKADFYGGGIYARSLDTASLELAFTRSTFALNQQAGDSGAGGGIWVRALNGSTLTLDLRESTVTRNKSKIGGGGGIAAGADGGTVALSLVNTTVSGNKGAVGAGVNISSAGGTMNAELRNCTVTANRDLVKSSPGIIAGSGGGTSSTTLHLANSIIWGNAPPNDLATTNGSIGTNPVTVTSDHSDIGCLLCGSDITDLGGSFDADPLLSSPQKNPHLTAASPCIDTGTCTNAPTTDLDGDARPTGAGCDVGSDEFVP